MALELAVDNRTDLQKARRGGRGHRTPAEVRANEGTTARKQDNAGVAVGVHDLPSLGYAPSHWKGDLRDLWNSLRDEVPWLRKSDRKAVIRYCRLYQQHEVAYAGLDDEDADTWKAWVETGKLLSQMETKFGMTPADRTRIAAGWKR